MVGCLLLAAAIVCRVQQNARLVPLYSFAISAADVRDISLQLACMNEPCVIEHGQLMVGPSRRAQLVPVLLSLGYPRHASSTAAEPSSSIMPATRNDVQRVAMKELQERLVDELRGFDGVADVAINLSAFDNDALEPQAARASLLLTLQPGAHLTQPQANAMANLVAYSLPGLASENVKIVDKAGRMLNDASLARLSDDEHLDVQNAFENAYRTKLHRLLDPLLGEGRYSVGVDVDLDFSTENLERRAVGGLNGEAETHRSSKRERYHDTTHSGPQYSSQSDRIDRVVGETLRKNMVAGARVSRLTASIAVNGLHSKEQLATLAELAATGIGIDTTRGDQIVVHQYAFWQPLPSSASVATYDNAPTAGLDVTWLLVLNGIALSLALWAIWRVLGPQPAARRQPQRILSGALTPAALCDMIHHKMGNGAGNATRCTETHAALDQVQPERLAHALKATWLAN
jgi:flagellar biosynthesis/type III secretory pathway M-ring protein FliF/YscJ